MKYFLLFLIQAYWKIIPPSKRKKCIFRESCSHYVWRITKEEGFISGIKAFSFRNQHCCPGYVIYKYQNHYELKTVKGYILKESDIDERLLSVDTPSLIDFDNPQLLLSPYIKFKI